MRVYEYEQLDISSFRKIGDGGFATVYRIPETKLRSDLNRDVVFKIFEKKRKSTILGQEDAMDLHMRSLDNVVADIDRESADGKALLKTINNNLAWPKALVVKERNRFCGYIMELIPQKYFYTYTERGETHTKESNFAFRLGTDEIMKRRGLSAINKTGRFQLAYNFVRIATIMHKHKVILGDLSPNNIAIYVDSLDQRKNSIFMIDTDSFRRVGTQHPMKVPHTPNWFPPECLAAGRSANELRRNNGDVNKTMTLDAQVNTQNFQTDIWKICLAIFRIYHQGKERTVVETPIDSPQSVRLMASEVHQEFANLIVRGIGDDPRLRPTAQELRDWIVNFVRGGA